MLSKEAEAEVARKRGLTPRARALEDALEALREVDHFHHPDTRIGYLRDAVVVLLGVVRGDYDA